MFASKKIQQELKEIKDRLDKYHSVVVANHTDLIWIKRGLTITIPIVLAAIIANISCEGKHVKSNSNNVGGDSNKAESEFIEYIKWGRVNNFWSDE